MRLVKGGYRPVWQPSQAEVDRAIDQFFRMVPDDFFVLRARTIGVAVATLYRCKWSPALALKVRDKITRLGCRIADVNGVHLVARIRARQHDTAEAAAISMKLRQRKRLPRGLDLAT